jgi:outer membrane protein OmpA-like peptidoglycan-associated protein
LNNLIAVLNKYPETNIEVQGHTDNLGTKSYDMTLSVKRATSIADYLKANGIAALRVTAKGFGDDNPEYDNHTPEGRAQNGRVEILISANRQMKAEATQEAQQQSIQGK